MFPDGLDGAKVLYFTPEDDYGKLYYETGGIAADFKYLAICQYHDSDSFCLFYCNERKEVETDGLWESIEACMSAAECSCGKNILWIKR